MRCKNKLFHYLFDDFISDNFYNDLFIVLPMCDGEFYYTLYDVYTRTDF